MKLQNLFFVYLFPVIKFFFASKLIITFNALVIRRCLVF